MTDWSILFLVTSSIFGLTAYAASVPSALGQGSPASSDGSPPLLVERDGSRLTIRVLRAAADSGSTDLGPAPLLVEREDSRLTIRVLQVEANSDSTDLTYELTVDRTGASTSRTRQTGVFAPAGALPDTLSTTRINVQPGDQLSLRLVLRRGDRVVDTVYRAELVPPSE